MKRFLLLLIVIVLLPINCFASSVKPTEKRGAIEFTELFMKRLSEYYAEESYEVTLSLNDTSPIVFDDSIIVSCSAGMLEIDLSTFSVLSLMTTFHGEYDSEQKGIENTLKLFSAIAALEYSSLDEELMDAQNIVNKYSNTEETSVLKEVEKTVYTIMNKLKEGNNKSRLIDLREKILVYSGNYDYYLNYSETEVPSGKTMKAVYLFAEAR